MRLFLQGRVILFSMQKDCNIRNSRFFTYQVGIFMKDLGFLDYFSDLNDPRSGINKLYPIDEILFTTLCSVICGAEGWNDVEDFGDAKLDFLREFLPYKEGVPSDDTFRRFFRAIDPKVFQTCFIEWVGSLGIPIENSIIAIDGKTLRRSHDGDKKAIHMVSAFATEARIVLAQQKTDEKSNEINAIPQLLDLLDIKGSVISIDAMGCQKKIASQIVAKEGDYILALKGNQSSLHDDIKLFFGDSNLHENTKSFEETDGGHGRIEVRKCSVTDKIDWLKENHKWDGLRSIIKIESYTDSREKRKPDTRYYISSLPADAKKILESVRSHWAIENSLHWVLDMSFNEDLSRIRRENSPENMAVIKHIALNMIRKIQQKRQSIKALRKKAGWDNQILRNIMIQNKV